MKWILVYIIIVGNDVMAVNAMGPGVKFDTMDYKSNFKVDENIDPNTTSLKFHTHSD